jgi:hypothetical protein
MLKMDAALPVVRRTDPRHDTVKMGRPKPSPIDARYHQNAISVPPVAGKRVIGIFRFEKDQGGIITQFDLGAGGGRKALKEIMVIVSFCLIKFWGVSSDLTICWISESGGDNGNEHSPYHHLAAPSHLLSHTTHSTDDDDEDS